MVAQDTIVTPYYMKEYHRFYEIYEDIDKNIPVTNVDKEALNAIIDQLNNAVKTNKAIITYWDYHERRLQEE